MLTTTGFLHLFSLVDWFITDFHPFLLLIPSIWNTLSANIRESTSLKDFKRKYLTNYFLTSNK